MTYLPVAAVGMKNHLLGCIADRKVVRAQGRFALKTKYGTEKIIRRVKIFGINKKT